MKKKLSWSWISDKEVTCLLNMTEAYEQDVIVIFDAISSSNISVKAKVNPSFSIPKNKILIMLSYQDIKRTFKSTHDLQEYFKHNFYKKNTQKNVGNNQITKKRTRFFVVPSNFTHTCMSLLDKINDPKYQLNDINKVVDEIKDVKFKNKDNTVESKITKTLISSNKIKKPKGKSHKNNHS